MSRMPRCRCRDGALHRATPAAARGPGRAVSFDRSLGALAHREGEILAGWLADHARPGLQHGFRVVVRRSLAPGMLDIVSGRGLGSIARAHPEWPGPGAFIRRSDRARYLRHMLGSRIDEAPIAASRSNIDFIYIYIYIYRVLTCAHIYIYTYIPCRSLVPGPSRSVVGRRTLFYTYIYIYIYTFSLGIGY